MLHFHIVRNEERNQTARMRVFKVLALIYGFVISAVRMVTDVYIHTHVHDSIIIRKYHTKTSIMKTLLCLKKIDLNNGMVSFSS